MSQHSFGIGKVTTYTVTWNDYIFNGEKNNLNKLAISNQRMAIYCEQSLTIARKIGDREREVQALETIRQAHGLLGIDE
ncbi:MAG: hypothetical protein HC881_09470 [Leptolyngbyaceae cyanobacterium SL_7_1]|nr:hypothetical protein [Leptolyngbyaceae cyanobacterium SL_7_1]